MNNYESKGLRAGRETGGCRQCPQCGAEMLELCQTRGQTGLFIWFECRRKGCGERRLLAMPLVARRLMRKASLAMPRLRGHLVDLRC